ncbi:hypothetical protein AVEN_651-1 [Araneus ventricosus]|uniref:Uncharacterized protein n=1 Tax=Araneus ventricosus TaxID=182803 RepID=A0A4Y2BVA8_ARAVE|nr:hypothetical protein AVEN_651-1 [Araneus ventricosus]
MSTADEVIAHEQKFSIAEILNTNEVTKFSIEKTMLEENPDSPIATTVCNSEEDIFENEQVSSDQRVVLDECYETAEIGISKKEISTKLRQRECQDLKRLRLAY